LGTLSLHREATVTDFLNHPQNVRHGMNAVRARRFEAPHVDFRYGTAE
jgi:hypothetical protein